MGLGGYTNRLDRIVRAITNGEERIKALETDYSNRLSSIDKKYRIKAQDLANAKNSETTQARKERQEREKTISTYLKQVEEFDKRIPDRLRKDISIDKSTLTPQDCDWSDLDQMAERILDDTLWGKVKGVLNVYGYYSRKAMVKDYLIHVEEARVLAAQESRTAKENYRIAEMNATQAMNSETQSADKTRKHEAQQENASFVRQKQIEQDEITKVVDQSKFRPISSEIKRDFQSLLRNAGSLGNPTLPKREFAEVLVGEVKYEFKVGRAYKASIEAGLQPFCKFPYVKLPFSVETHGSYAILVEASGKHRAKAFDGVRSIMARSIASYPFEGLEISYIDPIDRGTNLERFQKLSISDDCTALRPPLASEGDIEKELTRLEKAVDELSLKLATVGTVDDFNAKGGVRLPHRLIVVNDFPSGFSRKALESLNVLFNNREKCGLSFIVTHPKNLKPEHEVDVLLKRFEKESNLIREGSRGFELKDNGHRLRFSFIASKDIPDTFFDKIVSQYTAGKIVDNGFSRICDFGKRIDFADSTDGLFIPFAVNRYNEIINLELGTASAAHMVITGSTGSGKSTTLHAIIAGIMLRYHPKDVEIWLVDYKETEFAEYLLNKFPSIKLIGLDKSKDFTLALVDMISDEMEKRASYFASKHVQDLSAYKKLHGAQSYPRIVIIIDEFHNLAQTIKDEPSYVTKFENILSECRSAGMSCVFSDQSIMEGLRGLTDKGKKQLTSRIAMRNSPDEIRGTLDLDPSYYTDELKGKIRALGKGDVVMKREKASSDGYDITVEIDKYKSIHVRPGDRQKLVSYIAANASNCGPCEPLVVNGQKRSKFNKTAIQEFEQTVEPPRPGETLLYLGTPSNFSPCFRILLTKQLGQNIAVLGQEADRRMSVILYALRSFTRTKGNRAVVFAHPEDPLYEQYRGLFAKIAGGRIKVCDEVAEICTIVDVMSQQIEGGERKKTLVVLLGYELLCDEFELLPEKISESRKEKPTGIDSSAMSGIDDMYAKYGLDDDEEDCDQPAVINDNANGGCGYDARDAIGEVVNKGCRFGIHVLLSMEKTKSLRRVRTFGLDAFDHKIALPISPDESLEFFGTSQAANGIDQISVAYSDSGSSITMFRPYIVPKPKKGR